jgi:hypothetical protein
LRFIPDWIVAFESVSFYTLQWREQAGTEEAAKTQKKVYILLITFVCSEKNGGERFL